MVYESAKPWREADGDVIEAIDYLRYYACEAERLAQPVLMHSRPGETNAMCAKPRGVAAIIAPWNFPLAIICGMSSAARSSTGNCAILKPAAQSPLIAARLVEVLRDAGVPPGVVQYLPGPGSVVGKALVEHPRSRRSPSPAARRSGSASSSRRRSCGRASATSSASSPRWAARTP